MATKQYEDKIYYKVVRRYGNLLTSYNGKPLDYHGLLTYIIGEETKPMKNCGPLAVFRDINSARLFIFKDMYPADVVKNRNVDYYYQIFPCKIVKSDRNYLSDGYYTVQNNLPEGTVFADSIILLERE